MPVLAALLCLVLTAQRPLFAQDAGSSSDAAPDSVTAAAALEETFFLSAPRKNTAADAEDMGPKQQTEAEALAAMAEKSTQRVVEKLPAIISAKTLDSILSNNDRMHFLIRLSIVLFIIIIQSLLIWATFSCASLAERKARLEIARKWKSVRLKNIALLDTKQVVNIFCFLIKAFKWLLVCIQLLITIPNIFRLFERTRSVASTLLGYILSPVKHFALSFILYIPNLFTIAVIIIIARYIIRTLKFFATRIANKKLIIPGFYPEWAYPSFNILRVLIIAFTVAMVYPHLPNSESDVFKGVSVLVGVLFSLGSSSVIGNLISGLVMTYMRPFKVGDRIKINDITGFVVERGAMVVRIRTHKNEIISLPNQMMMNNSITNYTVPATEGFNGLIMHTSITMGYDVPWQKVHDILIAAALKTENTEKAPPPFVNQLKLDDFYCWYEINVYTKSVDILPSIYSSLYKNIQTGFVEEGISLYAPHFRIEKRVNEI